MLRSFIIISQLALALIISDSYGQNYVMERESEGFHGTVQLTRGNFENLLAIQAGYTWNGIITAGLDFGKGTDRIRQLSLNIIRPNINYLIVKQSNERLPISINIEAAYQYNILPATSFNSQSLQYGGTVYHEISIKDKLIGVKIIPHAGLIAENNISRNGFQTDTRVNIIYNAGFTVLWESVYFEPKFFINDGNVSYGLAIGYVL